MAVRAKFRCESIERVEYPSGYKSAKINLRAVDKGPFWEATPSGSMTMECVNEEATKQFVPSKTYFLDFTPSED
jgi:hypothetical protein